MGQAATDQSSKQHMKIGSTVLAVVLALGAVKTIAGPGVLSLGSTNVCSTNLVRTNLTGSGAVGPLSQYDADGDGTITSAELATASANMVQDLQSRFLAKYDANGDGAVT